MRTLARLRTLWRCRQGLIKLRSVYTYLYPDFDTNGRALDLLAQCARNVQAEINYAGPRSS